MKRRNRIFSAVVLAACLTLSACSAADVGAGRQSSAPAASEAPAAEGAAPEMDAGAYDAPTIEYESAPEEGEEYAGAGESYLTIDENAARLAEEQSTLTFSLKVDTAAYNNVERYIQSGSLPPRDAVRTEELVNYFSYDQPMKFDGDSPFALYTEVGPSPLDADKHIAMVRVKTEEIDKSELPSCNLTFLIDTSGSMNSHDKLPLLKEAFALLVETLDEDDVVSIVTYAGSSSIVLDSESGANKERILHAINNLQAGGSTAGAQGIHTAYALAQKNLMQSGNNRVLLATDGDFNVGISDVDELADFISEKKDGGVYLSILGFGTGNIRDDIMETLSKNGNGNYSYINTSATANKVLVDELGANLYTVADDVKAQVEFNPELVKSYRLIGYENRRMSNRDFEDDTKDAGEIGVGADVVVLFELELADSDRDSGNLFELRVRYKDPGESESKLITRPATVYDVADTPSNDLGFASAVAAFGHLLRGSEYTGDATLETISALAKANLGKDEGGYRLDFLLLLREYENLAANSGRGD